MKIDISEQFGLTKPVYVNMDNFQNLIDNKVIFPDAELHVGDTFVSLKNSDGEHILTVGIEF